MQWWQEHEMLKAAREELKKEQALSGAAGTHFTCFTSTYSVYLLYYFTTQREELKKEQAPSIAAGAQFTCFTGIKYKY
jgi:hypothetical protein